MKHVEKEWASYEAEVVPAEASDVQRLETKRAFYAGAWALLCMILHKTQEIEEDDPAGQSFLKALHDELESFGMRGGTEAH